MPCSLIRRPPSAPAEIVSSCKAKLESCVYQVRCYFTIFGQLIVVRQFSAVLNAMSIY